MTASGLLDWQGQVEMAARTARNRTRGGRNCSIWAEFGLIVAQIDCLRARQRATSRAAGGSQNLQREVEDALAERARIMNRILNPRRKSA
jgi:hypothetical protein